MTSILFSASNRSKALSSTTPRDYEFWDAIGYSWADPYRGDRVLELLRNGRQHTLRDMARYQTDYPSIPARELVPLLKGLTASAERTEAARRLLLDWDYRLEPESIAAGIYNQWEGTLRNLVAQRSVPESVRPYLSLQIKRVVDHLQLPDGRFGADPIAGRDSLLLAALDHVVDQLTQRLGGDMDRWQYGQEAYKHIVLEHPLAAAVDAETRRLLNVGPAPRGGNSYTVNSTGRSNNQASGASFRMLMDTGDWDHCLGTNAPGQNGDPAHPHYRNLFDIWAKDQYFPVFYTRRKVESVAAERVRLTPAF